MKKTQERFFAQSAYGERYTVTQRERERLDRSVDIAIRVSVPPALSFVPW